MSSLRWTDGPALSLASKVPFACAPVR